MIINISGKAQHGKDTTALILKEILETKIKVLIAHYTGIKYVCKLFLIRMIPDVNGRTILQYVEPT